MTGVGGVVAGVGVVLLAIVGLARYLLSDRSVAATHTKQIADMRADMASMKTEMALLRHEIAEQRTLKHAIRTEFAKTVMLLAFVEEANCTCGALEQFKPIIAGVLDEARRQGVLDQHAHEPNEGGPT